MVAGREATVDVFTFAFAILISYVFIYFKCCKYLATTDLHWVDFFFPSVKLKISYVDWKTSPEPPASTDIGVSGQ